ncbi:hypothetical protein SAMN05880590_103118 [Rhizobium sp. RU35A]|uniref:Uncharacterized protein n=1 Tax=Rhizobium straminoryzae TaxID=1387186 RepID=A0A549TEM8_9HYPH|nr:MULTISPECIES: hypothetical protein [Rhizobium]TRL40737.1 hypothetical protein FNA46_05365 [Rhizobium straminoryzae]SIQ32214.1 hypothetical protein SAMN05880590_103118 [Rhizobium sp. RU35A]
MPHAFHGFSFDLFAFLRRPHPVTEPRPAAPLVDPSHRADETDDERTRRINEDVAFWGLVAFPVL